MLPALSAEGAYDVTYFAVDRSATGGTADADGTDRPHGTGRDGAARAAVRDLATEREAASASPTSSAPTRCREWRTWA